jgi:hypothetical protein
MSQSVDVSNHLIPFRGHTSVDDAAAAALAELSHELADLLTVHPAPSSYRHRLREQLLASARDERIYRREFSRQMLTATLFVMIIVSSIGGLIIWRLLGTRWRMADSRWRMADD